MSKNLLKSIVQFLRSEYAPIFIFNPLLLAGSIFALIKFRNDLTTFGMLGFIAIIIGCCVFITAFAIGFYLEDLARKTKINAIENQLLNDENVTRSTLIWELGKKVLEGYLDRNLRHVKLIFFWTVLVMIFGFGIVVYGIVNAYRGNTNINTNLLTV